MLKKIQQLIAKVKAKIQPDYEAAIQAAFEEFSHVNKRRRQEDSKPKNCGATIPTSSSKGSELHSLQSKG